MSATDYIMSVLNSVNMLLIMAFISVLRDSFPMLPWPSPSDISKVYKVSELACVQKTTISIALLFGKNTIEKKYKRTSN